MAPSRARGFTYLGLIILLAILALVAAAGLKMGSVLQRAAAEEELLEIGAQFSEALRSYSAATPPGKAAFPATLQDLLKDPRFPNTRRHLRKIFVDPMTGKAEWGVVYVGDKVGVLAVYSLSDARPLKVANFGIRFLNMENREKISDWKFLIAGGEGGGGGVVTPPNSMVGSTPAPSLFPSAIPGTDTGGKSGAAPGAGAGGGKGNEPMAPPPPVPEEVGEDARPEEQPMPEPVEEVTEEEGKSYDKGDEKDAEETAKPVERSTIVTPPPPPPRRRF